MRKKAKPGASWHKTGTLLTPLSEEMQKELACFPEILESVWPLSRAHKARLPDDIKALSRILTADRAELRTPYWNVPAYCSAYLYYFLPWNLIRLAELLAALPLNQPLEKDGKNPLLLDAGSGPLTLPLALWLARADWREKPLKIAAVDSVRRPLELGQKILAAWAKKNKLPCWDTEIITAPIHHLERIARSHSQSCYPWLAAFINVLNEIRKLPDDFKQPNEDGNPGFLENLICALEPLWINNAPMLFVEPGTRLGGTTIMHLRKAALELGLTPVAPCTHNSKCPLLTTGRSGFSDTWCHFVFSAQDAPDWLKHLSKEARLFKTSLTLSPLYLEKRTARNQFPKNTMPCRVISRTFATPAGVSRYGCAKPGLCLLPDSRFLHSGSLCLASAPDEASQKDAKSGAVILKPASEQIYL